MIKKIVKIFILGVVMGVIIGCSNGEVAVIKNNQSGSNRRMENEIKFNTGSGGVNTEVSSEIIFGGKRR